MMSSSAKEDKLSGCRKKEGEKKEEKKGKQMGKKKGGICCRGANSGMLPHPRTRKRMAHELFHFADCFSFPPFVSLVSRNDEE